MVWDWQFGLFHFSPVIKWRWRKRRRHRATPAQPVQPSNPPAPPSKSEPGVLPHHNSAPQERWKLQHPLVTRPLQKPPHVDDMWPGKTTCHYLPMICLSWMEGPLIFNLMTESDQTLKQTSTTPSTVTNTDEDPIQRTNPGHNWTMT